jgi:hypothetical protein
MWGMGDFIREFVICTHRLRWISFAQRANFIRACADFIHPTGWISLHAGVPRAYMTS